MAEASLEASACHAPWLRTICPARGLVPGEELAAWLGATQGAGPCNLGREFVVPLRSHAAAGVVSRFTPILTGSLPTNGSYLPRPAALLVSRPESSTKSWFAIRVSLRLDRQRFKTQREAHGNLRLNRGLLRPSPSSLCSGL